MNTYIYKLSNIEINDDSTTVTSIQAGPLTINVEFQWAIVSDEQFSLIVNQFAQYAAGDPLIMKDGSANRKYNYLLYYNALKNVNLDTWLDRDDIVLPMSLRGKAKYFQKEQLQKRITLCVSMMPIIMQYIEVLRWQAKVTCNGETTIAVVQPGGWYRNQDDLFSFRFVSDLPYIGKEDLKTVTMEIEVYGNN